MVFKFALLAEATITDQTNKLSVIGIFSNVGTRELPMVFGHLDVVVGLQPDPEDEGEERQFSVRLIDPEGRVMRDGAGTVQVGEVRPNPHPIHLVLGFDAVTFAEPGPHRFEIYLEGELKESLPLEVHPVSPGGALPA